MACWTTWWREAAVLLKPVSTLCAVSGLFAKICRVASATRARGALAIKVPSPIAVAIPQGVVSQRASDPNVLLWIVPAPLAVAPVGIVVCAHTARVVPSRHDAGMS